MLAEYTTRCICGATLTGLQIGYTSQDSVKIANEWKAKHSQCSLHGNLKNKILNKSDKNIALAIKYFEGIMTLSDINSSLHAIAKEAISKLSI